MFLVTVHRSPKLFKDSYLKAGSKKHFIQDLKESSTPCRYINIFQEVQRHKQIGFKGIRRFSTSKHNYFKTCSACVTRVHLFLPLFNNVLFILQKTEISLTYVSYYHDIFPSEAKTSKALNIGPTGNTSVGVEEAINYSNDYQIMQLKCFLILQFQKKKKWKENLSCQLMNH